MGGMVGKRLASMDLPLPDTGEAVNISLGAAGEDSDLANFGLQRVSQGQALGQPLSSSQQNFRA